MFADRTETTGGHTRWTHQTLWFASFCAHVSTRQLIAAPYRIMRRMSCGGGVEPLSRSVLPHSQERSNVLRAVYEEDVEGIGKTLSLRSAKATSHHCRPFSPRLHALAALDCSLEGSYERIWHTPVRSGPKKSPDSKKKHINIEVNVQRYCLSRSTLGYPAHDFHQRCQTHRRKRRTALVYI